MAGWGWNSIFEMGTELVAPYGYDPGMGPTTMINGNYDYVQKRQTWDSNGPQTLPNSVLPDPGPGIFPGPYMAVGRSEYRHDVHAAGQGTL